MPMCALPLKGSTADSHRASDGQLHAKTLTKPLRTYSVVQCGDVDAPNHTVTWCLQCLVPKEHCSAIAAKKQRPHGGKSMRKRTKRREILQDHRLRSLSDPLTTSSCLLGPQNWPPEPNDLCLELHSGRNTLYLLLVGCQTTVPLGGTTRVTSDLELLTLPHGHDWELELLERHDVLALALLGVRGHWRSSRPHCGAWWNQCCCCSRGGRGSAWTGHSHGRLVHSPGGPVNRP